LSLDDINNEIKMLRVKSLEDLKSFSKDNKFKIPEPPIEIDREDAVETGNLDLVITPGLGFDKYGKRLGRGKGYYDKFFTKCDEKFKLMGKPAPYKMGIGLNEQIIDNIPVSEYDKPIDIVIYPNAILQLI